MKNYLSLLVLCLAGTFAGAQSIPSKQVPSRIYDSLTVHFPNPQTIMWSRAGTGYTAKFSRSNGGTVELTFDQTGNWQRSATSGVSSCWDCPSHRLLDSLGGTAPQKIKTRLAGYSQRSISTVHTRGNAPITVIVTEKEGKVETMQFDQNGNLMKNP